MTHADKTLQIDSTRTDIFCKVLLDQIVDILDIPDSTVTPSIYDVKSLSFRVDKYKGVLGICHVYVNIDDITFKSIGPNINELSITTDVNISCRGLRNFKHIFSSAYNIDMYNTTELVIKSLATQLTAYIEAFLVDSYKDLPY